MKTVTLKLTTKENMLLHIMTDIDNLNQGLVEEYVFLCKDSAKRMDIDILDNEYIIQDVDKFRDFLINEIAKPFTNCQELINYNRFVDILIKLDKECA